MILFHRLVALFSPGCDSIGTVPFRQKLLKFAVELGERSSHGGYPSPLKRENCTNNGVGVAGRRWCGEANGVDVGAAGRKGREGKAVNHREMMRSAVGKAMELGRSDSLCRETSVGPPRAIYFPRSLTAFTLVGSRFVIRRHTSSSLIFLRDDLLPPVFIYEELISRNRRDTGMLPLVTSGTANRCWPSRKKLRATRAFIAF